MTFMVDVCEAVLEQTHLESGFEKVLTSVPYAVFCSYSADVYLFSVEELEDFSERLSCFVDG